MRHATCSTDLQLREHGAQLYAGAATADLNALRKALAHLPEDHAGIRISGIADLRPFLSAAGPVGSIAADVLGPECRPVRAILFDKTAETNWSLNWHQDRTICVQQRIDVTGYGPWTVKRGMQHVEPPFDLLTRMLTLRVHLDDVPSSNSPLLIAPGSHVEGRIPVNRVQEVVDRCGVQACLANEGDVWLYKTTILHASEAASEPRHRRVLQVDFAAEDLPNGLHWLGV